MKPTPEPTQTRRFKTPKTVAGRRAAPVVSKGAKGVAGAKAFSSYVRSNSLAKGKRGGK